MRLVLEGGYTVPELAQAVGETSLMQEGLNSLVEKALGVPFEKFQPYYINETFLPAEFFPKFAPGFLRIIHRAGDRP